MPLHQNINKLTKIDTSLSKTINSRFPQYNTRLCYNESKIDIKMLLNNNSNNSNNSNNNAKYYSVKPCGKRAFLWFTYIDKCFSCILKFSDTNTNTNEYYEYPCDFDNTLSYNNVLLYGYYSTFENKNYFIMDTVLNYNNYNHVIMGDKYSSSFILKLKLLKIVIDKLANDKLAINKSLTNSIFLPYICTQSNEVFNNIYNLNYKPFGITVWSDIKNLGTYLLNNKSDKTNKSIDGIFKVVAGLSDDLYYLYCANNNEHVFHNTASVNTYKSSVYMNNLFRKVRENRNLDLIEESEDEDDFENMNDDKFVDLEKSVYMMCSYNRKFGKWIPKHAINSNQSKHTKNQDINVISKRELYFIEK